MKCPRHFYKRDSYGRGIEVHESDILRVPDVLFGKLARTFKMDAPLLVLPLTGSIAGETDFRSQDKNDGGIVQPEEKKH